MLCIGLDIGTTTISAVAADSANGVVDSITVDNGEYLQNVPSWESSQQPDVIYEKALQSVNQLLSRHPHAAGIGVTGQMHGIVYLDVNGNPVSPLYTWQDGRGNLPYDETQTYAVYLSQLTGYGLFTGYGMVTHFYNLKHNLVPKTARCFCTIHDFVAMKLAGLTHPVMDASDAASLGLFELTRGEFDQAALEKAGIDPGLLPNIAKGSFLGQGDFGLPIAVAIGDNQASFLGATSGKTDCLLINVGTGSQVSVYSEKQIQCPTLEIRPFPSGGYLLVGASLCGGRAYALLENFFRETVKMVMDTDVSCYAAMRHLLDVQEPVTDYPTVITTFAGTRLDPNVRGAFADVTTANMTPLHWMYGVMHGMTNELYAMYQSYLQAGGSRKAALYGSGNGLRREPRLCQIVSETFNYPLLLSENDEEAAFGAALFAFGAISTLEGF
jgi:sedoheptulokinase